MRTEDVTAGTAGNPGFPESRVFSQHEPSHATHTCINLPEVHEGQWRYIYFDWAIFGAEFDLALHAHQRRNGQNARKFRVP